MKELQSTMSAAQSPRPFTECLVPGHGLNGRGRRSCDGTRTTHCITPRLLHLGNRYRAPRVLRESDSRTITQRHLQSFEKEAASADEALEALPVLH